MNLAARVFCNALVQFKPCLFVDVPESISKLVNLTYLDLENTGISSALGFVIERHSTSESCLFAAVPESISKLINLTHLYLNGTGISSALDFVIERRSTSDQLNRLCCR